MIHIVRKVLLRGFTLAAMMNIALSSLASAQDTPFETHRPDLHRMLSAIGMYDILTIMGTEGINMAPEIEAQLFPGLGGTPWQERVEQLHTPAEMTSLFEGAFDQNTLSEQHITEVTTFAQTPAGLRIITGEVAARQTFLDQTEVEAAIETFFAAVEAGDPRLEILTRFNQINGLVERNVLGALNLRLAFFNGLIDGGAFDNEMSEEMMLAEVWSQEAEVRRTTVEWLFAFQLLAYAQVTNAELESYVALSETEAGRAVNAALFAAFDQMLADLSYDTGAAAAIFIVGEDT